MAPSRKADAAPYSKDEKVLCFHHEMLYEAKVLDIRQTETKDDWQFRIHYKGWKNTWDDWVPRDRVLKFDDENRALADQLHAAQQKSKTPKAVSGKKTGMKNGSDLSTPRGSEERHASTAQTGRGRGRNRDYDLEAVAVTTKVYKAARISKRTAGGRFSDWSSIIPVFEESFHARPSIKLVISDQIKSYLVDDWENVTKNLQLVPLPSEHPVNQILDEYLEFESAKREPGSAGANLLVEVVAGLREYFERCLGRILLYRFERNQYLDVTQNWESSDPEWSGKSAGDTYGAEHFCRLLVSLPELIAQTNMDEQSLRRLREELSKLTNWLGRNAQKYFVLEYETPTAAYIEKARAG